MTNTIQSRLFSFLLPVTADLYVTACRQHLSHVLMKLLHYYKYASTIVVAYLWIIAKVYLWQTLIISPIITVSFLI